MFYLSNDHRSRKIRENRNSEICEIFSKFAEFITKFVRNLTPQTFSRAKSANSEIKKEVEDIN